ncbi:MAG: polysaccharide biosynthesis/export family protein [Gemmatimonadota bacterium]
MKIRSIVAAAAALLLLQGVTPRPVSAQVADPAAVVSNAQRSMVTRAELTAALQEIDAQLASNAYSAAIRDARRAQAEAIRERLADGDLRTGDLVRIDLVGDAAGLTGTYAVTPTRVIVLPGGAEIPMRGVLRSEIQAYLTEQLKKYVRDPIVKATTSIRLSIFGAIAKPGLYPAPADLLLGDAIMQIAGGPSNNARFEKSQIKRGDKVIVDGPEFQDAIRTGRTLDQLNLQAGDEIIVAAKPSSSAILRILGAAGSVASLVYLFTRL